MLREAWHLVWSRPAIFLKLGGTASLVALFLLLVGTAAFWPLMFYALTRPEIRPPALPPAPPAWVGVVSAMAAPLLTVALAAIFLVLTLAVGALIRATAAAEGVAPDAVGAAPDTPPPPAGGLGASGRLMGVTAAVTAATLLGTAVLVLPGVWAFFSFAMALPAVVLEGLGPGAALRRSATLFRAHRWPVVATLSAVVAAAFAGWFVAGATGPLVFILAPLVGAVVIPWGAAALTLVFLDCRNRTPHALEGEK